MNADPGRNLGALANFGPISAKQISVAPRPAEAEANKRILGRALTALAEATLTSEGSAGRARELADRVTALLPRYAGRPSDPRTPQNLAPVAGLETWLRHRMGDRAMVRRALLAWLVAEEG